MVDQKLESWLESITNADYFYWWGGLIVFLGVIGLLNLVWLYIRLFADSRSVRQASKLEKDGYRVGDVAHDIKGVVKVWIDAIIGRAAQGHPSGVNELDLILHHRYSSRLMWIDWIRGSCTTIGLFFTFFGLGLALKELGDALQLSKTVVESNELAGLLVKVRSVLPTMGTAFASSIAGIGASFFLGIFENLINTKRSSLGASLADLSMRWLEPGLLPMNDTTALVSISGALQQTHAEIQSAVTKNTETIGLLKDLSERFDQFPNQNQSAWNQVHQELRLWIEDYFQKNSELFDNMSEVWVENTGRIETTLNIAQEQSTSYADHYNEMSGYLINNADNLGQLMGKLTNDLEVSSEHISQLSDATALFQDAQIESNTVISDSKVIQQQLLSGLGKIFEQVPIMTEAITEASSKTAASAERLETVILNSRMDGYISRLADLASFAEREKEAREQLFVVFDQLKEFGNQVNELNLAIIDIGRTASALKHSQQELGTQFQNMTRDTFMPVVTDLITQSVGESVQVSSQQSNDILAQLNRIAQRQESQISSFVETQKEALIHQKQLSKILAKASRNQRGSNPFMIIFFTSMITIISLFLLMSYGPAQRVIVLPASDSFNADTYESSTYERQTPYEGVKKDSLDSGSKTQGSESPSQTKQKNSISERMNRLIDTADIDESKTNEKSDSER